MKAARWFQCNASPLKNSVVKTVKMMSVMTSWMTLSCISENGPPLPVKPMRLAGIWQEYSKSAMPHDKRMTANSGQWVVTFISCNFKCPYQANVMKMLDTTSRRMV